MNRATDINPSSIDPKAGQALPDIDWASVNQTAPELLPVGDRQPDSPLPAADIVILTWTSAEWTAFNHVFAGSLEHETDWRAKWYPYTRNAEAFTADAISGPLWGYFQYVGIKTFGGRQMRVLLFKSNSHLAHPPFIDGLSAMIRSIAEDAAPLFLYSIGTAGGALPDQRLGDSVYTNSAQMTLQQIDNFADKSNGLMFRSPAWAPTKGELATQVEEKLLYKMNQVVTQEALQVLLDKLKTEFSHDPDVQALTLADLVNDAVSPSSLAHPQILDMNDATLLTTDYYSIAPAEGVAAHSFLEMDDAVLAREASQGLVPFYGFVRNISDPVVPGKTQLGKVIPDAVRSKWSGLIYSNYGLYTSMNGALATWATIAGIGSPTYNPPREVTLQQETDPLEVQLAYQLRSCGTCSYFWPPEKKSQPYGPYTAYDFDIDAPYIQPATSNTLGTIPGRTAAPAFPNPEVADGCRKAPIMTIGINPNLTAFLPGQMGAAWAYPNFTSAGGTDEWAKYAFYYRYRSVSQETFDLASIEGFLDPAYGIYAQSAGTIVSATRNDDSPSWSFNVRYDGAQEDTVIELQAARGESPWVLLFNAYPPNNAFQAGERLAGRVYVPNGIMGRIEQQPETYYMQFVPVLEKFQKYLQSEGYNGVDLQVGEDVTQLDMVACGSPHWRSGFLGGSSHSIATIVNNCVTENAWAMKQIVQSRPVVLYIVSYSSWKMFHDQFGAYVNPPLPSNPPDWDFTLLQQTTQGSFYLVLDTVVDGVRYQCNTRIVITPHFSYGDNFYQQFRMSPDQYGFFLHNWYPEVWQEMLAHGFKEAPHTHLEDYVVFQLSPDPDQAKASLDWFKQYHPKNYEDLMPYFFDPHSMMEKVLEELQQSNQITWTEGADKKFHLTRTGGSCQFCVNEHWTFPRGCPYGKHLETPPAVGYLEKVAKVFIAGGKPHAEKEDAFPLDLESRHNTW